MHQIEDLIKKVLSKTKYRIIELVLRGDSLNQVVEVFVDAKDKIDLDELGKLNKEISQEIDQSDYKGSILRLVLSSPGAEKPLVFLWQMIKHTGRKLTADMNDGRKIEGKILFVDEINDTIEIETGTGKKINVENISFSDIKSCKIKLPFNIK